MSVNQENLKPAQIGACPQLPGTILRVFIPAGAVINLLNLIEIASPSGICLVIRIPLLSGLLNVQNIVQVLKDAGASIQIEKV